MSYLILYKYITIISKIHNICCTKLMTVYYAVKRDAIVCGHCISYF